MCPNGQPVWRVREAVESLVSDGAGRTQAIFLKLVMFSSSFVIKDILEEITFQPELILTF